MPSNELGCLSSLGSAAPCEWAPRGREASGATRPRCWTLSPCLESGRSHSSSYGTSHIPHSTTCSCGAGCLSLAVPTVLSCYLASPSAWRQSLQCGGLAGNRGHLLAASVRPPSSH